jgi:hypothetical protein
MLPEDNARKIYWADPSRCEGRGYFFWRRGMSLLDVVMSPSSVGHRCMSKVPQSGRHPLLMPY